MTSGLTGLEIEAFAKTTSTGEITSAKLASEIGVSPSSASRIVNSLLSKGFLTATRNGKTKEITEAFSPASIGLKELIEANPHIEFASLLDGATLQALSGFVNGPTSVRLASRSSLTPEITERRVVTKLVERAVLQKTAYGKYEIRLPRLKEFMDAWLLQEIELRRRREISKEIPGSLIVSGPHGILRSTKHGVPTYMALTGLSVFHEYGVSLNFDFEDYYFHAFNWNTPKLGLEEHLVHSLLRSTIQSSGREVSYALLVMHKNWRKLDKERFLEYARMLAVSSMAEQSLKFIQSFNQGGPTEPLLTGYRQVEGPIFPSRQGFLELVKQYEPRQ